MPWLRLMRLPTVFTALTNILCGYFVSTDSRALPDVFGQTEFWLLLVSSALLYLGGMVLNDVFDYELDCQERPERPLPSGQIPLRSAATLGWLMMVGGLGSAFAAGLVSGTGYSSFLIAVVLAALVWFYDSTLKSTPFSPFGMAGCRFAFQPDATWKPKNKDLPSVPSIQFGKLVALRLENVAPASCTQNDIPSKIEGDYQCNFQFAWETEGEIMNISINPASLKMHWADASLGETENLPEALFPATLGNFINGRIEKIDQAFGDNLGELLISVKMPTESQLEDLANLQIQTKVPRIEHGAGNKMIEFIKEIV